MATEKIAIIGGAGELGFGLALRWAQAGAEVAIGSRDAGKAQEAAGRVRQALPAANVTGLDNPTAAGQANIVVLAVPFSAQAGILKSIKPALKNAILVDTSVPLAAAIGMAARARLRWCGLLRTRHARHAEDACPPRADAA